MLLKRLSLMLALLLPAVGMGCLGCTSSEPEPDPGPSFLERYDTLLANSNASGRAIGLAQLAEEQKAAGDTSGADASLTAAIQAAEEEEEALGKAAAFNAIAAAQGAMGRSGEAEDTLKDAKKAADTIESPADKASELCKIATTYGLHVPGKEAASKAYLSNASKLVEEVSSQKERSNCSWLSPKLRSLWK